MTEKKLCPLRDMKKLTGFGPDNLRDMRRLGLLADIGEKSEGAWNYSRGDVLALAIARLLFEKDGIKLEWAVQIGKNANPHVYAWLQHADDHTQAYREVSHLVTTPDGKGKLMFQFFRDPANAHLSNDHNFRVAYHIDCRALARTLQSNTKSFVLRD